MDMRGEKPKEQIKKCLPYSCLSSALEKKKKHEMHQLKHKVLLPHHSYKRKRTTNS